MDAGTTGSSTPMDASWTLEDGRSTPWTQETAMGDMKRRVDGLHSANEAATEVYYVSLIANKDNPDQYGVNKALDYEDVLVRDESGNPTMT